MSKEYAVGYRKPPKATRFKPGQSGNPKGRPKGSPNLASDLSAELGEEITVREGGQARHISKQRALIKSLMAKALKVMCGPQPPCLPSTLGSSPSRPKTRAGRSNNTSC
jgi:hypothetical protein